MTNLWLVRSPEYNVFKFWDVLNLLKSYKGVIRFDTKEPEVNEQEGITHQDIAQEITSKELSWFFEKCNEFRKHEDIGDQEMVVFLTDLPNHPNNFFNGIDFDTGLNLMVQTSGWDSYFPGSDERYPVAYHVAASVLIRKWFDNMTDAQQQLNFTPKGCMMDYCPQKDQVSFKMRTADISEVALQDMRERKVDPNLINHILSIFEGLRKNMLFKSRWLLNPIPQPLTIKGIKKEFYFKNLGNLKINLSPLHRVVYIFLLQYNNPEGFDPNDLVNHQNDLYQIYNSMFYEQLLPEDGERYTERRAKIEAICNINDQSNWESKISLISRTFNEALGLDLAKLYVIQGGRGIKKKIEIDRQYIVEEW